MLSSLQETCCSLCITILTSNYGTAVTFRRQVGVSKLSLHIQSCFLACGAWHTLPNSPRWTLGAQSDVNKPDLLLCLLKMVNKYMKLILLLNNERESNLPTSSVLPCKLLWEWVKQRWIMLYVSLVVCESNETSIYPLLNWKNTLQMSPPGYRP